MTKFGKTIIVIIMLAIIGMIIYFLQREVPIVIAPEVIPEIVVEAPIVNDVPVIDVENPLLVGVLGEHKDDLISFSILPNSKVHGVVSYKGTIKGAYFFEGNIQIGVLDMNKKSLKGSYATAKTEWMTSGPVDFEGNIDFTGLSAGPAYFEIHNDNASGLPENDKSILIPIVIE